MKPCKNCRKVLSLDDFYACKKTRDGHHNKCKVCWKESSRINGYRYYKKHYEKCRAKTWRQRGINITPDEFYIKLKEQNNCCAICGRNMDTMKKKLHVDHNHKTGQVRGLLCDFCNGRVIGLIENYSAELHAGFVYLNTYKARAA